MKWRNSLVALCGLLGLSFRTEAVADILVSTDAPQLVSRLVLNGDRYEFLTSAGEASWIHKEAVEKVIVDDSDPYLRPDGTLKAVIVADHVVEMETRAAINVDGRWILQSLKPGGAPQRSGKLSNSATAAIGVTLGRHGFLSLPSRVGANPSGVDYSLRFGAKTVVTRDIYGRPPSTKRLDVLPIAHCMDAVRVALQDAVKEAQAAPSIQAGAGAGAPSIRTEDVSFHRWSGQGDKLTGTEYRIKSSSWTSRRLQSNVRGPGLPDGRSGRLTEAQVKQLSQALADNGFKDLPAMHPNQQRPRHGTAYWIRVGDRRIEYSPEAGDGQAGGVSDVLRSYRIATAFATVFGEPAPPPPVAPPSGAREEPAGAPLNGTDGLDEGYIIVQGSGIPLRPRPDGDIVVMKYTGEGRVGAVTDRGDTVSLKRLTGETELIDKSEIASIIPRLRSR